MPSIRTGLPPPRPPIQGLLVNWPPGLVLKIDELPIDSASSSISKKKEISRLLDTFRDTTTYRLHRA